MFLHILVPKVQNKNENLEQMWLYNVVPILGKSSVKWPPKIVKKTTTKNTQNNKLLTIFAKFRGLSDPSYQFSEATFQQTIIPQL